MKNTKIFTLLIIISILGLTIFYNLLYYKHFQLDPDEGVLLADTERILDEPFPYLRFNLHFPGRYYLLAFFYSLFGRSIAVERIMFIFIHCLNNILAFFIAKKILPYPFNLLPSLLLLLVPGYWFKSFVALLLLLNLYAIFNLQKSLSKKAVVLSSLIIGFSFYFRIDIAGYGMIAAGIIILISSYLKRITFSKVMANLVIFSLSIILFISPLFILYGIKKEMDVPVNRIMNDIKDSNRQSSPFPNPKIFFKEPTNLLSRGKAAFFTYSSIIAFLLTILFLLISIKNHTFHLDIKNEYVFSSLILALLSFNHIWPFSTSIFRLPQSGILIHLLWAFILYQSFRILFSKQSTILLPLILLIFAFSLLVQVYFIYYSFFGPPRIVQDASTITQRAGPHRELIPPKGGISPPSPQARAFNRLTELIIKNTKPDDKIFCFGEAVLYFLSERKNATDFTNMTEMITDPESRKLLKSQIVYHSPKLIICKKSSIRYFEPYMPEIFEEISKRYNYYRTISAYRVFIRKKKFN